MPPTRIISWNVNGLRAAYKKGAFAWFLQEQPDIFCVQETKARPEQLTADMTAPDGYHAYFASADRKGYSGVALYSKREPTRVTTGIGVDRFDNEGRILIADYAAFTLLNIYFPNGKASAERLRYKMAFYEAFLAYVDGLREQGKQLIICGDVNTAHKPIDLARPQANEKISGFLPEERAWIDTLLAHGYVDTFRLFHDEPDHYTWWTYRSRARDRNVGWRIDYFFVNRDLQPYVQAAYILPEVMGSDHCPIGLDVEV